MEFQIDNLPLAIQSTKKLLRQALPNYAAIFRQVEAEMRRGSTPSFASANQVRRSYRSCNTRRSHPAQYRRT